MVEFFKGDKVRVVRDTFSLYGASINQNRVGTVLSPLVSEYASDWVLVGFGSNHDKYIKPNDLEKVVEVVETAQGDEPTVISFDEVKKGDRLRYTRKYSDDDILIREFVVRSISTDYIDSVSSMPAGGFSVSRSSVASGVGTLELLSRPKEDLKVGDVVKTLEDFKRLPDNSVVRTGILSFLVDAVEERFIRLNEYSFEYEVTRGHVFEIVSIP